MDAKIKLLSKQIELSRELLYSMISTKKLTDDCVVNCSQLLDNLLSEYHEYEKCVYFRKAAS